MIILRFKLAHLEKEKKKYWQREHQTHKNKTAQHAKLHKVCFSNKWTTLEYNKLTSLKESPYFLLMYFRKAVVHFRVVTLSDSGSQNGASVFSSSQYKRIFFLHANSRFWLAAQTLEASWPCRVNSLVVQQSYMNHSILLKKKYIYYLLKCFMY